MRVKVSSGNVATLTLQDSGSRAVLDAEWRRSPTRADIEELTRFLALSVPILSVRIEDAAEREKFTRAYLASEETVQ
jgi:hypothetical protein